MADTIKISRARVTFFWTHVLTDLLAEPAPAQAPMAFLGRGETYREALAAALNGSEPHGLEPPWPRAAGQLFWTYYLERTQPGRLKPEQGWRFLVPLRAKASFAVRPLNPGIRILSEAFFHPHCFATMLTFTFLDERTLEEFLDELAALARRGLEWTNGAQKSGGVQALARDCMAELHQRVFGQRAAAVPPPPPFCVASVLAASGVDPASAPIDKGEIHRALAALARGGSNTWQHDALTPLPPQSLGIRANPPPSHVLYASKRGRVVWFPAQFSSADVGPSLQCYHRNLCYAALQVESLCDLASLLAARVVTGSPPLSADENDCAQHAAGLLGRLYAGQLNSTYRSMSIVRHIQERSIADINVLRARYKMKPPLT